MCGIHTLKVDVLHTPFLQTCRVIVHTPLTHSWFEFCDCDQPNSTWSDAVFNVSVISGICTGARFTRSKSSNSGLSGGGITIWSCFGAVDWHFANCTVSVMGNSFFFDVHLSSTHVMTTSTHLPSLHWQDRRLNDDWPDWLLVESVD